MGRKEEIKLKKCSKCGRELPMTEEYFYKEKMGFKSYCKDCMKSRYKENDINFNIENWYSNKSNKFKNNWKYEDIKWIYDNYLNIDKQELLKHFNNKINYKTITNIIYQWNIKKTEKQDNWSDEEIKLLKENYSIMNIDELMNIFKKRTIRAINGKAEKLNLIKDEKVLCKIYSESHKGFKVSEETKKKMSKSHRGSKSILWKGGLTPLHPYFRSVLYEWKLDSLKAYDFKCAFTGENNGDLQIHHVNENFSDIILKTLNKLNLPINNNMTIYSQKELELINKTFLGFHYKTGLGVPLKKSIHQLFHTIYGVTNNTKEQFEEFKQRYYNGDLERDLKNIEENLQLSKPKSNKKYKRLGKENVVKIKDYINKGFPDRYIAKEFEVNEDVIYNIRTKKTYVEVS